jgi:hypothetical protein
MKNKRLRSGKPRSLKVAMQGLDFMAQPLIHSMCFYMRKFLPTFCVIFFMIKYISAASSFISLLN